MRIPSSRFHLIVLLADTYGSSSILSSHEEKWCFNCVFWRKFNCHYLSWGHTKSLERFISCFIVQNFPTMGNKTRNEQLFTLRIEVRTWASYTYSYMYEATSRLNPLDGATGRTRPVCTWTTWLHYESDKNALDGVHYKLRPGWMCSSLRKAHSRPVQVELTIYNCDSYQSLENCRSWHTTYLSSH